MERETSIVAPPLPQDAEKLLQELRNGNDSTQESAAEELVKLKLRDEQIINALKRVAISDKNKYIRDAAEEALYVLGYELSSEDLRVVSESVYTKQEATQPGRRMEGVRLCHNNPKL
jgi:hypothetical protein